MAENTYLRKILMVVFDFLGPWSHIWSTGALCKTKFYTFKVLSLLIS